MSFPPLPSAILYLDQFVISNLSHVRNGITKSDEEFWVAVNDRLTRLLAAGQIACPVSLNHQLESSLAKSSEDIKSTAAALSGGWSFDAFPEVCIHQLDTCFRATLTEAPLPPWRFQAPEVLARAIPFSQCSEAEIANLQNQKNKDAAEVEHLSHKVFATKSGKSLQKWHDDEFAFLLKCYAPFFVKTVPVNLRDAACHFLDGPASQSVPFLNTSAWMSAAFARKCAGGQRKSSGSILADIDSIACLSPYCDAMFVDRECHGLWSEMYNSGKITLPTRLFSHRDTTAFITFLDNLLGNQIEEEEHKLPTDSQ